VLFETWLVPIEGWFVDKYGPRLVVLIGGILCGIGWAINAEATSLNGYYLGMIVAGIGAGGRVRHLASASPGSARPSARSPRRIPRGDACGEPALVRKPFSALPTQVPYTPPAPMPATIIPR